MSISNPASESGTRGHVLLRAMAVAATVGLAVGIFVGIRHFL